MYKKFEKMPIGWNYDKTWGSPIAGYAPICDGKSILNGGKKGLLKVKPANLEYKYTKLTEKTTKSKNTSCKKSIRENTNKQAKLINDLARAKFKKHLLQELIFDLKICQIEGWDIKEYISDLKILIDNTANSILNNKKCKQPDIFGYGT